RQYSVKFSITIVPCQLICLLSLIVSQAIFDKAFKARCQSFEDLLKTPRLENTDCLELDWKEEMLEKDIFPIDYDVYLKLWNRLWLVAGIRDKIRPYSLRVSAGAALDGMYDDDEVVVFV
ncbi:hypothetical protein QBC38DRAFT_493849, partial [Podospora fimiseda]